MLPELDSPISFKEIDAVINKLMNGKAPGLNGIPPEAEAYKAMNSQTRCRTHRYVVAFFEGDADYTSCIRASASQSPKEAISPTQTNGTG